MTRLTTTRRSRSAFPEKTPQGGRAWAGVESVGDPDARNESVRIDERVLETERFAPRSPSSTVPTIAVTLFRGCLGC